jgi:type IV secretory pathway TrbD component
MSIYRQREEKMNKAIIESYLRNLLGVGLALVTVAMTNAGVASPLDLGAGDWLSVANGLWAAAVPTLLRYINKKDPSFGLVAEVAVAGVSKKLDEATKKASTTKKTTSSTTTKKKTGSGGGGKSGPVAR